ncbi:MAG TPA: SDR family oxidoreductase [Kofleriaceae bacterium]|nr:SDR family oxidoreductase [Kofleriaceae bacterium]
MADRSIFITGSSTGLGKAAAKLFAARGWRVLATMRQPDKETELGGVPGVTLLALDVTQLDQIQAVGKRAIELGPIDVVFNNAGYGLAGPLEGTADDQIVREIDTNLLGVIRTTQAFLPHFRERKAGLFITTTSIGGHIAFPFNSVYHATKWALEGWSESMAFELSKFGIGIKTVAPGGIKTDFQSRSLVMAQHSAYAALIAKALAFFRSPERTAGYSTAEQIAEVVYEAATDGKDQLRYIAGEDAKALYAQRASAGAEAMFKVIDKTFFG